ncbi:MAG: hypothetical protein K0S65_2395 [Labilithrix sp.]|jgi:hypothetical protein|nr:hypothetical protein [Labilithrix sp.]
MMTRAAWMATTLPAVTVPSAVGAALAAEVRERLEKAGYNRYRLVDRGSYDEVREPAEPELLRALAGIASEVTARSLVPAEARVLRLGAGDYLLVRHDRVYEDRPVELVLDLSPSVVPGAEVHWRHRGQVFFALPPSPGALAIVERGPTVMCNHTYVSKRNVGASVVRLVVLLRDVE